MPIFGYFHEYNISIWNCDSKILLGKVHLVPRYLERRIEKGEADISSSVDSPMRSLVFFLLNGFVAPIINISQTRMPRTAPLWPKRSPSSVTSATIINSNLCRTLFFILTSSVPYSLPSSLTLFFFLRLSPFQVRHPLLASTPFSFVSSKKEVYGHHYSRAGIRIENVHSPTKTKDARLTLNPFVLKSFFCIWFSTF